MIRLIDLNYHSHNDLSKYTDVLELQKASTGYVHYIKDRVAIQLIKHMNYAGEAKADGVKYNFFHSKNRFWYIPFKTNRYIKAQRPDIILCQGLIFPLQVMALRLVCGEKVKIVIQHHGEKPFKGVKKWLQKIADKYITAYLFTSKGNATEWIEQKIISSEKKCVEVLEAATHFYKRDKLKSKETTGMNSHPNFLWVGRLHALKDPITVLLAFEKYVLQKPSARMYMVYQTEELLPSVRLLLERSHILKNTVIMVGKVPHAALETWYSAADFFISGSHKEGSGFALLEAMACGCIPVVTDIPSFKKITQDGAYGILFERGKSEDLYNKLIFTNDINKETYSKMIQEYSAANLGHKAIADQVYELAVSLSGK